MDGWKMGEADFRQRAKERQGGTEVQDLAMELQPAGPAYGHLGAWVETNWKGKMYLVVFECQAEQNWESW